MRRRGARGGSVRAIAALLTLSALGASAQEPTAPVVEAGATESIEEIVIMGERPGPQLWKITNGEHTLWLLGLLSSPEIAPLVARARQEWLGFVEAALATSRVSLAMDSIDRVLAEDGTLAWLRAKGYAVRGP